MRRCFRDAMRTLVACAGVFLLAGPAVTMPAAAAPMAARDGADLPGKGTMRLGVFSPLTWVVADGLELETHPLITLVAPHITARYRRGELGPVRLLWEGGLSLPTPGLHIAPPGLAGYLGPSCPVAAAEAERGGSCEQGDHVLVLRAGVVASIGEGDVTSLRLDGAYGVLLGDARPRPFDTWAPLEVLLAPIARGSRLHAMVRHDRALHDRVRAAAELHIWRVGGVEGDMADRSLWTFGGHLGVDVALTDATRLQLGALYTNTDSRRAIVETNEDGFGERVFVRTQRIWPTFDVVWSF